jgi:apolipoprotein N-acyltransferase
MTAFLIDPNEQIIGRYLKRTLLPFGEYMPGQKYFPGLRDWATLHEIIEAGEDPGPLTTSQGKRLGVIICYEDMLGRNVHATVAAGAEILFSLINGAAFECPLTLEQHKRLALMRAVEHRRFFVRCSSTGVTCIISPTGEVLDQLDVGVESSLVREVKLFESQTIYTMWGDYFPWSCTGVVVIGMYLARAWRAGGGRGGAESSPRQKRHLASPPSHSEAVCQHEQAAGASAASA